MGRATANRQPKLGSLWEAQAVRCAWTSAGGGVSELRTAFKKEIPSPCSIWQAAFSQQCRLHGPVTRRTQKVTVRGTSSLSASGLESGRHWTPQEPSSQCSAGGGGGSAWWPPGPRQGGGWREGGRRRGQWEAAGVNVGSPRGQHLQAGCGAETR